MLRKRLKVDANHSGSHSVDSGNSSKGHNKCADDGNLVDHRNMFPGQQQGTVVVSDSIGTRGCNFITLVLNYFTDIAADIASTPFLEHMRPAFQRQTLNALIRKVFRACIYQL